METRQKIKDLAFELYALHGESFSLSDIANAIGIKKSSIYFHFESKEFLIREVIEDEMTKYFFNIDQENDDLKKVFFRFLEYYGNSQTKLLFWKRLLLLSPDSLEHDIVNKIEEHSAKRFSCAKSLILKEIEKGHIARTLHQSSAYDLSMANDLSSSDVSEEITLMFFSILHGLLSSVRIYHPVDISKHHQGIWELFWNSISNDSSSTIYESIGKV
jgi:AcrR family transcriptional regulator